MPQRRRALLALLGACSRAEPLRVELVSEEHHGQAFSTLVIRFRDPALTQRLSGLVAKVHAHCVVGRQVYDDEVEPIAPMIANDLEPNLVYTTDELEVRLFSYSLHPLFGVPDRCDVTVTAQRGKDARAAVLGEICLRAGDEVSSGRCVPPARQ